MGTIQQADPVVRRKAIWLICIAALVGFCAILVFEYFHDDFKSWLEKNIDFLLENTIVPFVVSLVLVLPLLWAGTYLLLLGNRTVRAQRFPPPGYKVARDTLVLEGLRALRRGRIIQLLSLLLLCSAAVVPIAMWYVFHSFASTI